MKLCEIYSEKDIKNNGIYKWVKPKISFEVFPPQSEPEKLYEELSKLKKYSPEFISLTCRAGEHNQESNIVLEHLKNDMGFNVMPHLTCVCTSKTKIFDYLKYIQNLGVKNILALRGDIPENKEDMCHDFHYANELVDFIRKNTDLSIGVAGYPEGHIESPDVYADIENLKKKVDAGAQAIFTQLFFNNDKFFSYIQLVRDAGINIPIIAGIMPILSHKQISKMVNLARIEIPKTLADKIEKYKDDFKSLREMGIDFACYQCNQLIDRML